MALEPGYDRFWRINGDDSRLNRELEQFYNFEIMLEKNGIFMPETKYNQRRITYLYTWFQTGNAVVMLLNNNTIQVSIENFDLGFLIRFFKNNLLFHLNSDQLHVQPQKGDHFHGKAKDFICHR